MGRSTNSVRTERINTALGLLQKSESLAAAARTMIEAYGMSTRQAYRYLQEAQTQQKPLPIPERKVAFTVKLSPAIVEEVHQQARQQGQSLSRLVEQALQTYLQRENPSG
jgi:predicted HicB family RNase H-like nuclease